LKLVHTEAPVSKIAPVNAPDFICPICLPKPKSSGYQ
jgi:hypothetical protein